MSSSNLDPTFSVLTFSIRKGSLELPGLSFFFIKNFLVGSVLIPMFLCSLSIILASFHQSLFSFNPLTPRILLVIFLTVFLTVLVMLVWRIWYWISLWSPDWYLFFILITCLHILYWYCKEKFCLGHSSPTLLYMYCQRQILLIVSGPDSASRGVGSRPGRSLCCVLELDSLLSWCLSLLRSWNGNWQIVREAWWNARGRGRGRGGNLVMN